MIFILNMLSVIIIIKEDSYIQRKEKKSISYEEPLKMTVVIICSTQEYGEHRGTLRKKESMGEIVGFQKPSFF